MPSRNAFNMAGVGGEAERIPTRACETVGAGSCARAASGHAAAAPPSSVMNSRRFIRSPRRRARAAYREFGAQGALAVVKLIIRSPRRRARAAYREFGAQALWRLSN